MAQNMPTRLVVCSSAMVIAGFLSPLHLCAQRLAGLQTIRSNAAEFGKDSRSAPASHPSLDALTNTEGRQTYWLEGGVVGGVALGALGYELGSACPRNTGSCPRPAVGSLIGATLGFVIGAFLGDTIEKNKE